MQDVGSPIDIVKQFLANFEKRQRNLGKRKSKLDSYKEKLAKGEVLNDEQKKAVEGYESVLNSISLMQEMATQSKELLNAVEKSSIAERSKMEREIEERTISFLQISTFLQRFLSMLDNPLVRDAIIKSTSEGNLKLLDSVRVSVTAPLPDNLPGSSSSDVPSHLQSREDLKSVSQNLYNLVIGRSAPIPNGKCPKKHSTFKDARNLCFRLMTNPTVQHSMGICGAPDNVRSSVDGAQIENSSSDIPDSTMSRLSESNDQSIKQNPDVSHDVAQVVPNHHESLPEVPTEASIDHINPFANTFNFLQASRIEVPVQLPEESANYGENLLVLNSENSGVEFISGPTEVELHSGSGSIEKHVSGQSENGTHLHAFVTEEPVELVDHTSQLCLKTDSTEEVEVTSMPSKPISYADSVRKISFTGSVPQRAVNETQSTNKRVDKVKENREDRGDTQHQNVRNGYTRGGSYRGRSTNFDGRGDRGAPRRGVGSRASNNYGRGGATRGMPQGIAQTTY